MKRLPIELETEEEDEDNNVKPLRRVRVMLPDKLSEINGYVSLSPFINSTPDASPQAFENSSLIRSPMSTTTSTTWTIIHSLCRNPGLRRHVLNESSSFREAQINPSIVVIIIILCKCCLRGSNSFVIAMIIISKCW